MVIVSSYSQRVCKDMSVNIDGCLSAIVMLLCVLQLCWEGPIGFLQSRQLLLVHQSFVKWYIQFGLCVASFVLPLPQALVQVNEVVCECFFCLSMGNSHLIKGKKKKKAFLNQH